MTDADILNQLGLTDSELTDLLYKTNAYFHSLDTAQKAVFLASNRSSKEAAATLQGDVTADQLEDFLMAHGKDPDIPGFWCRVAKDDAD
jgi:hypothetical protein